MADYQAVTAAMMQFERDLFDGPVPEFEVIVQEGRILKAQEEVTYRRMSRAREKYGQLPR
jgi:hypothetical protein